MARPAWKDLSPEDLGVLYSGMNNELNLHNATLTRELNRIAEKDKQMITVKYKIADLEATMTLIDAWRILKGY